MERSAKKVKKISPGYLKNLALWYLDRFGGTRMRTRATLMKRVRAAELEHGPTPEAAQWVEEALDDLTQQGLINDAEFARSRVAKGLRMGKSQRLIAQDLAAAGIEGATAQMAVMAGFPREESGEDQELASARLYVAKRRLGHHRLEPAAFEAKDMGALARRGFSYEIARRALKGENEDW